MNRWSDEVKSEAMALLRKKVPYSEICTRLGVPKSTLSLWATREAIPRDPERQLRHLRSARKLAVVTIRRKRLERIANAEISAKKVADALNLRDMNLDKALLAMLYWAEGGKQEGNLKFTNTDADLALLFLTLLRRAYSIDESRIRIALQIHETHIQAKVLTFWSKKLGVPKSQFWKPYVKPRGTGKNYRENFAGICNVHYASSAIQRELIALGREIGRTLS